jgi:DNA-binding response OmpR family regulator
MVHTNPAIQIYLLRKQPEVWVNGVLRTLDPQALKLLIILADEGEQVYSREDLVNLLYGADTPQTREAFRKRVLLPLRKILPENTLQNLKRDLIQFQRRDVFVDSREFSENATRLTKHGPSGKSLCFTAEN